MIIQQLMRWIFYPLDLLIYNLISSVYGLMMDLAGINVFGVATDSTSLIAQLSKNIYVLLGILMLFKLAFSFLKYIINPDDLDKKGAGGAGLVKQIIIVIGLILVVPLIFKEAYAVQKIILKERVVEIIAFGTSDIVSSDNKMDDVLGQDTASTIFSGFVQPNNNISEISSKCSTRTTFSSLSDECLGALESQTQDSEKKSSFTSGGKYYSWMNEKEAKHSLANIFDFNAINAKSTDGENFVLDYSFFLSTVVGIVFLYLLILTCLDIAKRTVMLGFLQLVAPIPIIYSLQPGDKKLESWAKKTISTFLSLFVRLATFFLGIRVFISLSSDKSLGVDSLGFWPWLFLVFGIFFFIKELPGIMKDLFGFNGGGAFSVNPKKGLSQAKGIGRGTAGLAAGAVLGAGAAWGASRDVGKGKFKSGLSALGGALRGGVGGTVDGYKAKSFKDTFSGAYNKAGKNAQGIYNKDDGKSFVDRFKNKMGMTGGDSEFIKKRADQDKMYNTYKNQVGKGTTSDSYNGMIKNQSMRDALAKMTNMKNERNSAQSEYLKAQSNSQSGNPINISSERFDELKKSYGKDKANWGDNADIVDALRIESTRAESNYNSAKSDYDNYAKTYTADAEAYSLYSAGKDRADFSSRSDSQNNSSSGSSSSNGGNGSGSTGGSSSGKSGGSSSGGSGYSGGSSQSGGTSGGQSSSQQGQSSSNRNSGGQTITFDGRTYHQNDSGIWIQ